MQSTPMRTLRSRQRFPDDPQALVTLTLQQIDFFSSVQHSMKRFMNHFSVAANSYHQLMDDLLQCLDLSWETTSVMDTNVAEIMNSIKQCYEFFNENLATPVKDQVERQKMIVSELDRWKKRSKKLDQRLKSLESAQSKSKKEATKEKAKYRAEDAASICLEDANALRPTLIQLNTEGVKACCQTWILMSQGFTKMNESLSELFLELTRNARLLERQAKTGNLPAWTETNTHGSRLRVSVLNSVDSSAGSDFNSVRSLQNSRNSVYEGSVSNYSTDRSKSILVDHNRKIYKGNNRWSRNGDGQIRSQSISIVRANSTPEYGSTDQFGIYGQGNSNTRRNGPLTGRAKSMDGSHMSNYNRELPLRNSVLIESPRPPPPVERRYDATGNLATSGVPPTKENVRIERPPSSVISETKASSYVHRAVSIHKEMNGSFEPSGQTMADAQNSERVQWPTYTGPNEVRI